MSYIAAGLSAGATLCTGGEPLKFPTGHYIAPTVFDHVTPDMSIARDEVFSPVLTVIRFKNEAEAVHIANDIAYGLSASIWTANLDRALTLTRKIKAGTVWVNCFMDGFPELPFGGYKQSGLGRELGKHAVEDYTETKTLLIHTGPRGAHWSALDSIRSIEIPTGLALPFAEGLYSCNSQVRRSLRPVPWRSQS